MKIKYYRNVIVTRSQAGATIWLYWHDAEELAGKDCFCRILYFPGGVVMESVKKAIKVLMRGGSTVRHTAGVAIEQWKSLDQNPALFDLIADAEEPEQAFVSRYILEA